MARHTLIFVFSSIVFLSALVSASAQPPAPSPVSPQGAIAESSPDFVWTAVPDALYYLLFVQDANGVVYSNWHAAADAGCGGGAGNCAFNPVLTLDSAPKEWAVMAWNDLGTSPLSPIVSFFVGVPDILSVIKRYEALEINGTHLHTGADPTVTLGGSTLTVIEKDANGEQVIAALPTDATNGTYKLTVSNANGNISMPYKLILDEAGALVLKDNNGTPFGSIVSYNPVRFRMSVELSNSSTVWIPIPTGLRGSLDVVDDGIFFESLDCTGIPYFSLDEFQLSPKLFHPTLYFHEGFLYSSPPTLSKPIRLYVASSTTPTSISANSELYGAQNNNCKPLPNPQNKVNVVPAELVESDFTTVHPLPYSLEVK